MYFKSKTTERKIYVRCKEYKSGCPATGSISVNLNDNAFFIKKRHNHRVRRDETSMRELRNILAEQCVAHSPTPYSAKALYMQAIKICPEGAYNYTYLQATERMRQIRKSIFPPTPRNLLHLHQLLQINENRHFTLTFQAQPNLFYQGPLMVNGMLVGLVFCNTSFIQDIAVELQNITVAGCDGTFKTVPKTIDNDCYQLFTFQIVYKNVSYPLVYALLNGKSEAIYTALFARIKDMIPLQYQNLMIITDYEIGQIKAIQYVFREITHQGCYFHYCQAILRYARNKSIGVYNLVKINPVAARVFRMILALPYLPSERIGRVPSVVDGVNAIIVFIVQYEDVALAYHRFIYEYIIPFWIHSITPKRFTVYNRDIRTNNYLESYHAVLLKIIRPHPKIWEFIDQLRYLENTCEVEFKQASNNLKASFIVDIYYNWTLDVQYFSVQNFRSPYQII
ncbi:unnamed protein product [Macrosiphum euphorbiae]|uniref:MULE transposase domain-containing protein n=2 Tax=Macrosiphum euphorbiae TaxID=13131 RepID=A0AAV0VL07_9HEMI|nr:unnamed protein product [Macrosiphum euphorbiae]